MQIKELANRYAKSILELVGPVKSEGILQELKVVQDVISKDKSVKEFLFSPLVPAAKKVELLKKALVGAGLSEEAYALVMILAQKDRITIFEPVIECIQEQTDLAHGVARGTVRSASVLSPEERKRISEIVSQFTNKQVLLSYKEDPAVIGGLIAEVGSFTFDDTLTSHLRRLKEEMTRRV